MTEMWENPILVRELRARMRGAKAFWLLFGFIGTLALALSISYAQWYRNHDDLDEGSFIIGQQFCLLLFGVQMVLVYLITPALTCGALSLERENRTYEALEVSLLPRKSIVAGKLASAIAFVGLLLSASLPLTAASFLLGGVSPGEIASAYLALLVSALVYGALGLALSSFVKTTTGATVLTYVAVIGLYITTLFLSMGGAPLVTMNPFAVTWNELQTGVSFGWKLPSWLPSLVLNGLLAALFALTAIHRLEGARSTWISLLRGLSAVFCGLVTLSLCGSFLANTPLSSDSDGQTTVACILIGAGALLAMLFATGAGASGSFLALRTASPKSGATFTLLTIGVCCLIYAGMALFCGTNYGWWEPLLVVLSATFGLCGVALGASARLKNRWIAMATVAIITVVLFVSPVVEYNAIQSLHFDPLLFLSPFAAASDAITGGGHFRDSARLIAHYVAQSNRTIPWTFWEVSVAFYLLLGTVGLIAARSRVAGGKAPLRGK